LINIFCSSLKTLEYFKFIVLQIAWCFVLLVFGFS
jgi:hypothetical protein